MEAMTNQRDPTATRRRRSTLSWALVALLGLSCTRSSPPSIALIILDTTRADAVSSYGLVEDTTPVLDALAAEGLLYRQAHSQSESGAYSSYARLVIETSVTATILSNQEPVWEIHDKPCLGGAERIPLPVRHSHRRKIEKAHGPNQQNGR